MGGTRSTPSPTYSLTRTSRWKAREAVTVWTGSLRGSYLRMGGVRDGNADGSELDGANLVFRITKVRAQFEICGDHGWEAVPGVVGVLGATGWVAVCTGFVWVLLFNVHQAAAPPVIMRVGTVKAGSVLSVILLVRAAVSLGRRCTARVR